jgi:hypothetical protein
MRPRGATVRTQDRPRFRHVNCLTCWHSLQNTGQHDIGESVIDPVRRRRTDEPSPTTVTFLRTRASTSAALVDRESTA